MWVHFVLLQSKRVFTERVSMEHYFSGCVIDYGFDGCTFDCLQAEWMNDVCEI